MPTSGSLSCDRVRVFVRWEWGVGCVKPKAFLTGTKGPNPLRKLLNINAVFTGDGAGGGSVSFPGLE